MPAFVGLINQTPKPNLQTPALKLQPAPTKGVAVVPKTPQTTAKTAVPTTPAPKMGVKPTPKAEAKSTPSPTSTKRMSFVITFKLNPEAKDLIANSVLTQNPTKGDTDEN
jgi:hypothetical protein